MLIAADCVAVNLCRFAAGFYLGQGCDGMMDCPEFVTTNSCMWISLRNYLQLRKLNSVTVLIMEVLCSAMLQVVKKVYNDAWAEVSVRQVVVSTQGLIVDERAWSDGTCSDE